jgi:LysR family nitrogen assimilation transcriptional regulator
MDIRQLRYFLEVVDAKSFTKAADRVRVAQPALGFQVKKLEEELGVPLLVRHSRGVEPTEAGRVLLRHAQSIMRQVDQARQELIDLAGPPRGRVVLGVTPTTSSLLATPLVTECRRVYPEIVLNLVEALSEQVMRWLADNRVDLGFTYNPDAVKGLRTEPLLVEDLYFIGPGAEGARYGETVTLAAVAARPLILPTRPHGTRLKVEEAAERSGATLQVAFEIDSVNTIRELVEAGAGYTVLPYAAVQDWVKAGGLFARRIVRPRVARTLHLGYSAAFLDSSASQAVRGLIGRLVAERAGVTEGYGRVGSAGV